MTDSECNETDVRLNGATPESGGVEVCQGGIWRSVCGNWWDYRDATVVCRQLRYDGRELSGVSGRGLFILLYFFSIICYFKRKDTFMCIIFPL